MKLILSKSGKGINNRYSLVQTLMCARVYHTIILLCLVHSLLLRSVYFFEHNIVHICFRGKDFRQEFSRIGEIRSLVPKDVNLMALTATANLTTRTIVITSLDMH